MAFFCTKTGVRIAKAGVSKAVDPDKGHDEVVEVDGVEEVVKAPKPKAEKPAKSEASKPDDKPAEGGAPTK
jgi:hypothetical protein